MATTLGLCRVFAFLCAVIGAAGEALPAGLSGGFVGTSGSNFVVNGSPYLFNGFNSYWMMTVASDPTQRHKVSNVFRDASLAGLSVCRTWAFSDGGYQALQSSPGVYDEKVFQITAKFEDRIATSPNDLLCCLGDIKVQTSGGFGLDFVISEAKKYNVRLILSLVNNYKDYGGKSQYVNWARNLGVSVNLDDEFYTNTIVKGYYKNHIKKVLTRVNTFTRVAYKDDPIIMAWELMNEPRCELDVSGKTVNGWIQEMAPYLKSIDSKHLLEVGLEGFYGDSKPERKQNNPSGLLYGTDFITNAQIKEIDFTTIHAYPDVWLSNENDTMQRAFVQQWMTVHSADAAAATVKKPLVFAEFGRSKKVAGYSVQARESYLNEVFATINKMATQKSQTRGLIAGSLVWQVMAEGMESYYDGYEIVLSQDQSTTAVLSRQSQKLKTL